MTPRKVRVASPSSSEPGSPSANLAAEARRLGWAAFDTPEARKSSAGKARIAVVIFSLHVALFQLILSSVYPVFVGTYYGPPNVLTGPWLIFLGLSLLYLALAILVGLAMWIGRIVGYVLCVVSIVLWVILFVGSAGFWGDASTWLIPLSIIDSVAILATLVMLQDLAYEPSVQASATDGRAG